MESPIVEVKPNLVNIDEFVLALAFPEHGNLKPTKSPAKKKRVQNIEPSVTREHTISLNNHESTQESIKDVPKDFSRTLSKARVPEDNSATIPEVLNGPGMQRKSGNVPGASEVPENSDAPDHSNIGLEPAADINPAVAVNPAEMWGPLLAGLVGDIEPNEAFAMGLLKISEGLVMVAGTILKKKSSLDANPALNHPLASPLRPPPDNKNDKTAAPKTRRKRGKAGDKVGEKQEGIHTREAEVLTSPVATPEEAAECLQKVLEGEEQWRNGGESQEQSKEVVGNEKQEELKEIAQEAGNEIMVHSGLLLEYTNSEDLKNNNSMAEEAGEQKRDEVAVQLVDAANDEKQSKRKRKKKIMFGSGVGEREEGATQSLLELSTVRAEDKGETVRRKKRKAGIGTVRSAEIEKKENQIVVYGSSAGTEKNISSEIGEDEKKKRKKKGGAKNPET